MDNVPALTTSLSHSFQSAAEWASSFNIASLLHRQSSKAPDSSVGDQSLSRSDETLAHFLAENTAWCALGEDPNFDANLAERIILKRTGWSWALRPTLYVSDEELAAWFESQSDAVGATDIAFVLMSALGLAPPEQILVPLKRWHRALLDWICRSRGEAGPRSHEQIQSGMTPETLLDCYIAAGAKVDASNRSKCVELMRVVLELVTSVPGDIMQELFRLCQEDD